ncbi:MAG: hypothetical protein K2Q22_12210 [Cytophagales bacterium]|nr:hypothetical protein [Cytophagales bacterium]
MKGLVLMGTVLMFLYTVGCQVQRKPAYELPAAMLPHVKAEYAKMCDKGAVLYDLSCAKCHNKKVKGRKVIPDFPEEKLAGYSFRMENPAHESEIPETKVSGDELNYIITFLSYKKKSNVPLLPVNMH